MFQCLQETALKAASRAYCLSRSFRERIDDTRQYSFSQNRCHAQHKCCTKVAQSLLIVLYWSSVDTTASSKAAMISVSQFKVSEWIGVIIDRLHQLAAHFRGVFRWCVFAMIVASKAGVNDEGRTIRLCIGWQCC